MNRRRQSKSIRCTPTRQSERRTPYFLSLLAALVQTWGCDRSESDSKASQTVVVYCSVDEAIARPTLESYGRRAGVDVQVVYDSEAGKTTGLIQRIIAEAQGGRPRADVLWSSEVFNTILLARQGLLEAYDPPSAEGIPARFRDPAHRWTALAARARVIAFDPKRTPAEQVPRRWEDLIKGGTARRVAIGNPLFGTTRGHVAVLFARWGDARGRSFLESLRAGGARLVDGNSAAVRAVLAGQADFAVTDTDDVWIPRHQGESLDLVYPDLGDGGTLLIPCSVALLRGGPHAESSRALVDFLVSAEVERILAESEARHVPVREELRTQLDILWPPESVVDYAAVADAMSAAESAVREILIR